MRSSHCRWRYLLSLFFFFNDTATTEIYTLSLHDALPICTVWRPPGATPARPCRRRPLRRARRRVRATRHRERARAAARSEEHTSELQSQSNLVCRLLLEKKKILSAGLRQDDVVQFSERQK